MLTPLADVDYPVFGGPLDGTSQAVPQGKRWIYVALEHVRCEGQPAYVVLHEMIRSPRYRIVGLYALTHAVTRRGEPVVRWEWAACADRAPRASQGDGWAGEDGG